MARVGQKRYEKKNYRIFRGWIIVVFYVILWLLHNTNTTGFFQRTFKYRGLDILYVFIRKKIRDMSPYVLPRKKSKNLDLNQR